MCERMAAAWVRVSSCCANKFWEMSIYLKKLHLLVFAEYKFGSFAPVWGMFPPMLDEARRVAVYLQPKIVERDPVVTKKEEK